jgi:hypothetical protein
MKARFTPLYFAGVGYGFAWNNSIDEFSNGEMRTTGGMHWQAGIGYRINFNKLAFTINLGYRNQRVKSEYTYFRPWDISDVEITEKRNLRRFVLSMGITL